MGARCVDAVKPAAQVKVQCQPALRWTTLDYARLRWTGWKVLSALHSKHSPDPPTPCIAQPLTPKLLRAGCHGASNQNSLRGPHQSRPVFALATRPALALLAAHSARCLRACAASRPACQRLRVSKGPGLPGPPRRPNETPLRPLKHARNCCEQARH